MKHTPGPWIQDKWGHVKQTNGESVPFGGVTLAMSNSDEIRANDRLVATAPELLEACQRLMICMKLANWEGDDAALFANAAIQKATGE